VHRHRWVYVMIIVVGALLALGIAGVPSTHQDTPVQLLPTTTTVAPASPGASG
jgi:hypothetical protein